MHLVQWLKCAVACSGVVAICCMPVLAGFTTISGVLIPQPLDPSLPCSSSSAGGRLQLVPLLCSLLAAVAPRAKGANTPTGEAHALQASYRLQRSAQCNRRQALQQQPTTVL